MWCGNTYIPPPCAPPPPPQVVVNLCQGCNQSTCEKPSDTAQEEEPTEEKCEEPIEPTSQPGFRSSLAPVKRTATSSNGKGCKKWVDENGNEHWTDNTGKEYWVDDSGVTHWIDNNPPGTVGGGTQLPPRAYNTPPKDVFESEIPLDLFDPSEPVQPSWTDSFIQPFRSECSNTWFDNIKKENDEYEDENPMLPSGTSTNPPAVLGCMDPVATNFNASATVDDGSCVYTPPPVFSANQKSPNFTITNYRTEQEIIEYITQKSQESPYVTSQDPDGIDWLVGHWDGTDWDGIPINDAPNRTKSELCAFLRPGHPYIVKGIRQLFYQVNPFADNTNPTVTEIENWQIECINHVRKMLGSTVMVKKNARLSLEARWCSERKHTTAWDVKYPDSFTCLCAQGQAPPCSSCYGYAPGPCFLPNGTAVEYASGHCGDAFWPTVKADRDMYINAAPYFGNFTQYPELQNYNNKYAQATGGGNGFGGKIDIPWSISIAKGIVDYICGEALTGHAGPYSGFPSPDSPVRTEFGCSYWLDPTEKFVGMRGKWR